MGNRTKSWREITDPALCQRGVLAWSDGVVVEQAPGKLLLADRYAPELRWESRHLATSGESWRDVARPAVLPHGFRCCRRPGDRHRPLVPDIFISQASIRMVVRLSGRIFQNRWSDALYAATCAELVGIYVPSWVALGTDGNGRFRVPVDYDQTMYFPSPDREPGEPVRLTRLTPHMIVRAMGLEGGMMVAAQGDLGYSPAQVAQILTARYGVPARLIRVPSSKRLAVCELPVIVDGVLEID